MVEADFIFREGFSTAGPDGYVSRNVYGHFLYSPPYIIASTARNRIVPGKTLGLFEMADDQVLSELESTTGVLGEDVYISPTTATQLAAIGRQVLMLNEIGHIQPPLDEFERQSAEYLIQLVGRRARS
jgi:hypothetical protein